MSNEFVTGDVAAAIVTYGSRAASCIEVAESALACEVRCLVVVLNGCTSEAETAIEEWARMVPKVSLRLIRIGRNSGSAGGFSVAVRAASALSDWIWLLDDDNVPEPEALRNAMRHASVADNPVLAMARDTDEAHARILSGVPPTEAFPVAGAFFGADVWKRLASRRSQLGASQSAETWEVSSPMPESSYGGLLLHRSVVAAVGLPRQELQLYFDDVEYTRRIVASGYTIKLLRNSRIKDLGVKWADTTQDNSYARAMSASGQSWKTYYSFGNSHFLEWRRVRGLPRCRYVANGAAYFLYATVQSRFNRTFLAACVTGVSDGARGRLGRTREFE